MPVMGSQIGQQLRDGSSLDKNGRERKMQGWFRRKNSFRGCRDAVKY